MPQATAVQPLRLLPLFSRRPKNPQRPSEAAPTLPVSHLHSEWIAPTVLSGCSCGAVHTNLTQFGQRFGLEYFFDQREKQALLPLEVFARSRQRHLQKLPRCYNSIGQLDQGQQADDLLMP